MIDPDVSEILKIPADEELQYLRARVKRQGDLIAACADMLHNVQWNVRSLTYEETVIYKNLKRSLITETQIQKARWRRIRHASSNP